MTQQVCVRHRLGIKSVLLPIATIGIGAACGVELPDLADGYGPPSGWDGPVFHLSKQYPANVPPEPQPWKAVKLTDSAAYLQTVLDYCLEGNLDAQSTDPTRYDTQF